MYSFNHIEEMILKEKPYSPLKHFLFLLPEMFGFLLKVFVVCLIGHLFFVSIMASSISTAVGVVAEGDVQAIINEIN